MGYQAGACALTPGGGLYALAAPRGRAVLCAEGMENGKLLVKELLCAPEDRDWVLECLPSLLPHWCMTVSYTHLPRRSFGDFPIAGKVTRRPQAAKFPLRTTTWSETCPLIRPLRGHLPPRGKA